MSEFQAIPDLVLTLVLDFVSSLSLTLSLIYIITRFILKMHLWAQPGLRSGIIPYLWQEIFKQLKALDLETSHSYGLKALL